MKKLVMALVALSAAFAVQAEPDYYVQLAAWAPGQLPTSANTTIWGLRGSIFYGDCQRFAGLDLGLAGRVRERAYGLQVNGILNLVNSASGCQVGFANFAENEFYGLQVGAWNHAAYGAGTQLGLVNTAGSFAGVQLGLFNWADDLDGVQIGLANVVADQKCVVLPIVNAGF